MHPLHQEIKREEAKQTAMEALLIPFMVPLVISYLIASLLPLYFFYGYTNESPWGLVIWSIINVIFGTPFGIVGACIFAWKRKFKIALRFLIAGLGLWFFMKLMIGFALFVYRIPPANP